jgi:hypothetical protein
MSLKSKSRAELLRARLRVARQTHRGEMEGQFRRFRFNIIILGGCILTPKNFLTTAKSASESRAAFHGSDKGIV